MEYERSDSKTKKPDERIQNFNEFHLPFPEEERKLQGARCMECGVPFCQAGLLLGGMVSGCPLLNLIPEWNDLVYRGNTEEALSRLLKTNNFPEFTGRVCPAPCEAACTCAINTLPVTIKENELGIIEAAYEKGLMKANPPEIRTGKKAAVIGSGPAGLACADQLNKRGHSVVVFERDDRAGGLMMYGIPNMKLEKQILERRIKIMKKEGIEFKTGVDVGRNYKASYIKKNFDSVVLACGASSPRDLNIPGRKSGGVLFAVDYLKGVTKSLLDSGFADEAYLNAKNKHVLVVGGGDTGNDCVGTAIRHGAESVLQLEMLPKPPTVRTEHNPWPEWPKILKTDYGQEEAIAIYGQDPRAYQTTVKKLLADESGNVCGAELVKLEQKKDEMTGRLSMIEIKGSEYEVKAELVLIAAGFLGAQDYIADAFGVTLNDRLNVNTGADDYYTTMPGVFTAGDMRRGQSLVVWAIREGREAARAVDEYLMGYTNL